MTSEEYKTKQLEKSGVEPLTQEQKAELRQKKEEYQQLKGSLEAEIAKRKVEIKGLDQRIRREIPSIPRADYIHDRNFNGFKSGCGLRTAIYFGRTPQGGLAGGDDVHYCLFCEEEF